MPTISNLESQILELASIARDDGRIMLAKCLSEAHFLCQREVGQKLRVQDTILQDGCVKPMTDVVDKFETLEVENGAAVILFARD